MKTLLFALAAAVMGCALMACRSAPPGAGPAAGSAAVQPAAPLPTLKVREPSPSLRPPVSPWLSAELPALPEPPANEAPRPISVTLEGVSAGPARVGGLVPHLFEPRAPSPTPSARAHYALIERVAASGARRPGRSREAPPAEAVPQAAPRAVAPRAVAPPAEASSAKPKAAAVQPPKTRAPAANPASTSGAAPIASTPTGPASASSAAAAGTGQSREVLARAGDPIEIAFDGRGWLYLGMSAEQPMRSAGVSFLGGGSSAGRSVFGFRAVEHGQYTLRFQLQDNVAGRVVEESVRLSVLPDAEFAARLSSHSAPLSSQAPGDPRADSDRVAAAERWFSLGEYDRAVTAFLEGYREGDPHLTDRVAASYAASGDHLAAAKYYRRNLQTPEPFASQAVAGLVRAALATGDSALLLEQFPALLRAPEARIGGELLEVGRAQLAEGRFAVAQEALREYLRRYPDGRELDEVCFLLAQLLESESPFRDLRGARDLYHRVYEEFPESRFSAPAQVRRDYLTRHFFQVR